MKFEYTIKTYSMQQLSERGVVVDPEKNIVYACRPDGACEIREVGTEQIEHLSGLFNEMGREGWELVQLLFRPSGMVSFWKRNVKEGTI
jgi:hypothetical protein